MLWRERKAAVELQNRVEGGDAGKKARNKVGGVGVGEMFLIPQDVPQQ